VDVICGEGNQRCKTDENGALGEDGLPLLVKDEYGHILYTGDKKYPTLASIFIKNDDTSAMYGLTGGSQVVGGYMGRPDWTYKPGDFLDMLVESFAGTHDFIGGQIPGFYDEEGNTTRGRSGFTSKAIDTWAVTAVPLASPFALSDLISPELLQIIFAVGR
jgi:filamentous hemagglutinin